MRTSMAVMLLVAFVALLCAVSSSEEVTPARPPRGEARRPTPQMEEARRLTRRLRELSQELRSAGAQARQVPKVQKAFAKVRKLEENLRKAQQNARAVMDKAILKENPDLAKLVQERKKIEEKLRELRSRPFRREAIPPDRSRPRPPRPPAEAPSAQARDTGAPPTIVHFDIPADDVERAQKFYAALFGWRFEKSPGPMEYWLISTSQEKGGEVAGGMMQRQQPQQPITDYFDVPSIDESAAKIQKLGGKVTIPKMPVPGMGYFAVCLDTENNVFAIWETDESAK